ncbi:MAG: hypothetical protein ACXAE3_15015 [Candidatus Kariarchaeaceae archaeon]|jgi:hypothetical protein
MSGFLLKYTISNTVLWGLGFAAGLVAGFAIPLVGDVVAVILVGALLFVALWFLLDEVMEFKRQWIRQTAIYFAIGLALSFFTINLVVRLGIGLAIGHTIAVPTTIVLMLVGQTRVLSQHDKPVAGWLLSNLAAVVVGFALVILLSTQVNLYFELLDVRQVEYAAILPWGLIGAILGLTYGIFTGLSLEKLSER